MISRDCFRFLNIKTYPPEKLPNLPVVYPYCTWGPVVSPVQPCDRDPYAQRLHFGMGDDHDGNGSKALFQKMLSRAHLSHSLRNGIHSVRKCN